jgi:hypothetical protein
MGLDGRFALDIGSVVHGIRPRGLMHVGGHLVMDLERLLGELGLTVIASRRLRGMKDAVSREGVLSDSAETKEASDWGEVWFASEKSARVEPSELFKNPGQYLGYPECCCRALQNDQPLASLYCSYMQSTPSRHWKLNRLAALFHEVILMPDFFPCSLGCQAALRFVEPFTELANAILAEDDLRSAKAAMRAPVTLIGNEIVFWPAWRLLDGKLYLHSGHAKKEHIAAVSSKLQPVAPDQCVLIMFEHLLAEGWGEGEEIVVLDAQDRESLRLQPVVR